MFVEQGDKFGCKLLVSGGVYSRSHLKGQVWLYFKE